MPGPTQNLMYSFNMGPVHFVGINTEVYYYSQDYGKEMIITHLNWLKKNLKEATKPRNRKLRPWIITYGHRPMYCSNENNDDCTKCESLVRVGLEDLFYKYGVDVEIWAHEHSYERLWPIYNHTVYNGSLNAPYTNPGAPVHIVTGSAGCREGREPFLEETAEWSAFHSEVRWSSISHSKIGYFSSSLNYRIMATQE